MKSLIVSFLLVLSIVCNSQNESDKTQIEATLNNYIDGFYKGDTITLKKAIKPRLYKFGYLRDKQTGVYKYYQHLSYDAALSLAQKLKDQGRTRSETRMRSVKVLEISNHIAAAKVTAAWGIDYVLLSKDNGKWMIEQVIWEGPFEQKFKKEPSTTTYFLIRHAEKDRSDKTDNNPHLTEKGLQRAKNWAKVLNNITFDAIYSTDYHRTKETALPTAKANNLQIKIYDPRNLDLKLFMKDTKGKNVLIVGHSNTTPMFANGLLGEKKYEMIADDNNANLYTITITEDSTSSSVLVID